MANPAKPEWQLARARVTSCKASFLRSFAESDKTVYRAKFEYVVHGVTYRGAMSVGTPWKPGRTFEITYDPRHPSRNSANENFDPSDWHSYVFLVLKWGAAALFVYLLERLHLPSKADMMRP